MLWHQIIANICGEKPSIRIKRIWKCRIDEKKSKLTEGFFINKKIQYG